jgi:AraC family transcriptional regulator
VRAPFDVSFFVPGIHRLLPGRFYGLPLGNASGGPFGIRAFAAAGREEDVETHTHDDAHFVLVLSGTYVTSAYGAREAVRSPTLIFNPPGTTHRDRFTKGIGNFMTVSVGPLTFRETADLQPLAPAAMQLAHPDALKSAFHIVREMCSARDAAVLESSSWELLSEARSSPRAASLSPAWAMRAYEALMDSSSTAQLRIGDVATEIGVHPVHLARVFRRVWGCSPGELLRWRRTDRAAELLRRTTLTAAQIAQEVGFADQSHLTHAFRTRIGLTPSAYRRVFRGYKTVRGTLE